MLADNGALMLQLLDSDGDPMHGDIGKVDVLKKTPGSATAKKNSATGSDGTADNYSGSDSKCTDEDGADGCDAEVKIDREIMFASGTALGCETSRMVTFSCSWDATGGHTMEAVREPPPRPQTPQVLIPPRLRPATQPPTQSLQSS